MTQFTIENVKSLSAGKYLVFGDLKALSSAVCPAESDKFLNDVFFSFNYDNKHLKVETETVKTELYFGNTSLGEGAYNDSMGGVVVAKYGVIGFIRIDDAFNEKAKELAESGGYIFNADRDFDIHVNGATGEFVFLDRSISTD